MRSIKKLHKAIDKPIEGLTTFRAIPNNDLEHIDPFLFLNHHGPHEYLPANHGLPFGPHPHKGFETLTFIMKGDIIHWDSGGSKKMVTEGGIQWMTAGRGLIHSEVSSDEFKKNGGIVEFIQIWLNLPSALKNTDPKYIGLQKDKIPGFSLDNNRVTIYPVSGNWDNVTGPVKSLTGIHITRIEFKKGGLIKIDVDNDRNVLFYVVRGILNVNNARVAEHVLAEFGNDSKEIVINAIEDSELILGHGKPYHEPIIAQGPFVMNSIAEIKQAIYDYHSGKIGFWSGS